MTFNSYKLIFIKVTILVFLNNISATAGYRGEKLYFEGEIRPGSAQVVEKIQEMIFPSDN